jgi:hypothetical protein
LVLVLTVHVVVARAEGKIAARQQALAVGLPVVLTKNVVILHPAVNKNPDFVRKNQFPVFLYERRDKVREYRGIWREIPRQAKLLWAECRRCSQRSPAGLWVHVFVGGGPYIESWGSAGIFKGDANIKYASNREWIGKNVSASISREIKTYTHSDPSALGQYGLFIRSVKVLLGLTDVSLHRIRDALSSGYKPASLSRASYHLDNHYNKAENAGYCNNDRSEEHQLIWQRHASPSLFESLLPWLSIHANLRR